MVDIWISSDCIVLISKSVQSCRVFLLKTCYVWIVCTWLYQCVINVLVLTDVLMCVVFIFIINNDTFVWTSLSVPSSSQVHFGVVCGQPPSEGQQPDWSSGLPSETEPAQPGTGR